MPIYDQRAGLPRDLRQSQGRKRYGYRYHDDPSNQCPLAHKSTALDSNAQAPHFV